MTIVLEFEKHTVADCPINNEKTRKIVFELAPKLPELYKKYGIKPLGFWTVHSEHLNVMVFDVPSLDVIEKLGREPALAAWKNYTTTEFKFGTNMEETMNIIKQAK